MVSLQSYFKAYVASITQRTKYLSKRLYEKRKIDREIYRKLTATPKQIENLKKIIGKDSLFKPAEKRHKQTLRHYTWKISKSFQFFIKKEEKLQKKLKLEDTNMEGLLSNLYNKCKENSKKLADILSHIGYLYYNQVIALDKREFRTYIRLCDMEREKFYEIQAYSYFSEIKAMRRDFVNLVKYLLKKYEYPPEYSIEGIIDTIVDIIIVGSVILIPLNIITGYRMTESLRPHIIQSIYALIALIGIPVFSRKYLIDYFKNTI